MFGRNFLCPEASWDSWDGCFDSAGLNAQKPNAKGGVHFLVNRGPLEAVISKMIASTELKASVTALRWKGFLQIYGSVVGHALTSTN